MQVGILGSGDVGKTLACGFIKHGHQVMLGTRTGDRLAEWAAQNPSARTGGFAETATFGKIVALAVKGTIALDALHPAGAAALAGKTVIDAANPIADTPPVNGVLSFFTDQNELLMERLQGAETRFVKAFNSVGAGLMINPRLPGGTPTMFICGNDEAAKATVHGILDQFGWDTADMGRAEAARANRSAMQAVADPGLRAQSVGPRPSSAAVVRADADLGA